MSNFPHILETASGIGRPLAAELLPLVYNELRSVARERMANLLPGGNFKIIFVPGGSGYPRVVTFR